MLSFYHPGKVGAWHQNEWRYRKIKVLFPAHLNNGLGFTHATYGNLCANTLHQGFKAKLFWDTQPDTQNEVDAQKTLLSSEPLKDSDKTELEIKLQDAFNLLGKYKQVGNKEEEKVNAAC